MPWHVSFLENTYSLDLILPGCSLDTTDPVPHSLGSTWDWLLGRNPAGTLRKYRCQDHHLGSWSHWVWGGGLSISIKKEISPDNSEGRVGPEAQPQNTLLSSG